ncbi:hypothetical protein EV702DRAFT_1046395 [Suillus placidus]|uniref:Uncharacterized protein n=1 Tax=Suillus placidus TaxID=48579 RepID=A0A9P7D123_9AGAM|nr:hypothetical protein EV702DRAFT_1046395 [Suillus placidus]
MVPFWFGLAEPFRTVIDFDCDNVGLHVKMLSSGFALLVNQANFSLFKVKAFTTSSSKSRQAILREANSKWFIKIWAGTQLEASLYVSNYHQAFLTDESFHEQPQTSTWIWMGSSVQLDFSLSDHHTIFACIAFPDLEYLAEGAASNQFEELKVV